MNDDFSLASDFLNQHEVHIDLLIESLERLINELTEAGDAKKAEFVQFKLHGLRSTRLLLESYQATCENLLERYSVS